MRLFVHMGNIKQLLVYFVRSLCGIFSTFKSHLSPLRHSFKGGEPVCTKPQENRPIIVLCYIVFVVLICPRMLMAQSVERIPYGNFDSWLVRQIKESSILGGKTQNVYAIAPTDTIRGSVPYRRGVSPWATSNVLAIVSGVTKTSNTVFPEPRGRGYCARMETSFVTCKVLGLLNITVVASGSVFLGETIEPITGTSNPYSKIDMGIPYAKRPKVLMFDYNATISTSGVMSKATGIGGVSKLSGNDPAEIFILLQSRKENEKGEIAAKRIATAKLLISKSTSGWVNGYSLPLVYGEKGAKMPLESQFYAKNSKGKMMLVNETQWGDETDQVTHIVVMFSSGSQGAYVGAVGNILKVDNVRLTH